MARISSYVNGYNGADDYLPHGAQAANYVGASTGASGSSWEAHASAMWQAAPHPIRKFSDTVGFGGLLAVRTRSGARTITRGGWMTPAQEKAEFLDKSEEELAGKGFFARQGSSITSMFKREWQENYRPKSWFRGPTAQIFNPDVIGKENRWAFKSGVDGAPGEVTKAGEIVGKVVSKIPGIRNLGITAADGGLNHIWDPGMIKRWSAAGDYAKMGDGVLDEAQRGAFNTFLDASKNSALKDAFLGTDVTGTMASQATRLSATGALSGRFAGMMEGMRGGVVNDTVRGGASESARIGLQVGENVAKAATRPLIENGARVGVGALAKGIGARAAVAGAEVVGALGEGGLNPIMDLMAIYSIAKLGLSIGSAVGGAVERTTKDAVTSFRGQVGKAPFGMGYKDTAAAATSRQRGVMAIQNSRLNMRSILGSEAGMMSYHYSSYG